MSQIFTTRTFTLSAVASAALAAGLMVLLTGASEQVSASSPLNAGKGDRIDIRVAAVDCASQTWPNIAPACVKDSRQPTSQARQVRVVSTDRIAR
jgi:hypothetical protein